MTSVQMFSYYSATNKVFLCKVFYRHVPLSDQYLYNWEMIIVLMKKDKRHIECVTPQLKDLFTGWGDQIDSIYFNKAGKIQVKLVAEPQRDNSQWEFVARIEEITCNDIIAYDPEFAPVQVHRPPHCIYDIRWKGQSHPEPSHQKFLLNGSKEKKSLMIRLPPISVSLTPTLTATPAGTTPTDIIPTDITPALATPTISYTLAPTGIQGPIAPTAGCTPITPVDITLTLHDKPKLNDLMELIAVEASNKWMEVGILLEIDNSILDNIRYDISLGGNPQKFLLKVLTIWKENPKRPYTWNTILNVLASSSVGFISLADEIKTKLLSGGNLNYILNTETNSMSNCLTTTCIFASITLYSH
jgi:hypothetical protein